MRILFITLLLILAAHGNADAGAIQPGDVLQIRFNVSPDVACDWMYGDEPCDTLQFAPSYSFPVDPPYPSGLHAKLFDGSRLLGEFDSNICCVIAFISPNSVYGYSSWITTTVVDFTSILDGTIDGILEISPIRGPLLDLDLTRKPLSLAYATGATTIIADSDALTITGYEIIPAGVPEPGGWLLAATGVFFLMLWRRSGSRHISMRTGILTTGLLAAGTTFATPIVISGVPAYEWYHGCTPTAAGSVFGYWDTQGFDNLFNASGASVYSTWSVQGQISSQEHNAKYIVDPRFQTTL